MVLTVVTAKVIDTSLHSLKMWPEIHSWIRLRN